MPGNRNNHKDGPFSNQNKRQFLRFQLCDALGKLFRRSPHFSGKQQLAALLNRKLTPDEDSQAIVMTQMRDGSRLRLDLRSATEWPAFWTGKYDSHFVEPLLAALPPRAVVLDVGANIGFYTVPLGRKLKRLSGKLYAIEPVPSNFTRLVENISLNHLQDVVTPLRLALGSHQGTVEMYRDAQSGAATGNAVVLDGSWGKANATAPATTLDLLAKEKNITACHLIKVDIEGGEMAFFQGGKTFIQQHRPLILCELNPFWMTRFGWTFADLQHFTSSLDYRIFRREKGRFISARNQSSENDNVLLVPKSVPEDWKMSSSYRFFRKK